jgi:hypothetical protein
LPLKAMTLLKNKIIVKVSKILRILFFDKYSQHVQLLEFSIIF